MKKTFYLEGARVTGKYIRELVGERRFQDLMDDAIESLETDPAEEIAFMTIEGIVTVEIQFT